MMIRTTSLILLLACTSIGMAQPLYKWIEADGSITFSPNQPPAGTPYDTVQSASDIKSVTEPTVQAAPVSAAATPAGSRDVVAPRIVPRNAQKAASPNNSTNRPAEPLNGITASSKSDASMDSSQSLDSNRVASIAASNKHSRCQDLRKRVVSLERRLKSRLTPEDMDNTVIHMARYQRSFDQYCEQ